MLAAVTLPVVVMVPEVLIAVEPAIVPLVIALPLTFPAVLIVAIFESAIFAAALMSASTMVPSAILAEVTASLAIVGFGKDPVKSPPADPKFEEALTHEKAVPSEANTCPAAQVGRVVLANSRTEGSFSVTSGVTVDQPVPFQEGTCPTVGISPVNETKLLY